MKSADEALSMPVVLTLALISTAIAAACYDLRVRRIPNWINVTGVALGVALNAYFDGANGLLTSGGGLLMAICIYIPLYALKGMGAGDVKLMAAIGAIAGPANWLNIFIVTALLGGLASLVMVVWKKKASQTATNVSIIMNQILQGKRPSDQDGALSIHHQKALKMPHGAVIAAGVGLFLALHWNA